MALDATKDLEQRFIEFAEQKFQRNALARMLTSNNYQAQARGADKITLKKPNTTAVAVTAGARNSAPATPDEATADEIEWMFDRYIQASVTAGIDDRYDGIIDPARVLAESAGEQLALAFDKDIMDVIKAGIDSSREIEITDNLYKSGTNTNSVRIGDFDIASTGNQNQILDALLTQVYFLEDSEKLHTGVRNPNFWVVMDPLVYLNIRRLEAAKNYLTPRQGSVDSGNDVRNQDSRVVANIAGFPIYLSTAFDIAEDADADTTILVGASEATEVASSYEESRIFDGTETSWAWRANYRRRYGRIVTIPELLYGIKVGVTNA